MPIERKMDATDWGHADAMEFLLQKCRKFSWDADAGTLAVETFGGVYRNIQEDNPVLAALTLREEIGGD